MNGDEALKLCRMVKAGVPSQAFEDETPALWAMTLRDVRFTDAMQAVVNLLGDDKRDTPYLNPADVRREVKRIRAARLTAFGPLPRPPAEVEDGTAADYQAWLRDTQRRIADGEVTTAAQLPAGRFGNRTMEGIPMQVRAITTGPGAEDVVDAELVDTEA